MSKILSIIIPSCNMEKYLGQCLDSLLVPSIGDVEILVINDGSKDHTSEIAHGYSQRYPQSIRVIDKPNGHYGSCINRGLKEATGKYVKILDADDSFDSEVFEKFIEFLKDTDADLVLSNYCRVDEDGTVTQYRQFLNAKDHAGTVNFKDAMIVLSTERVAMHCVCYRTNMLTEMEYQQTEGVPYTDQEWIFEPMIKVERVAYFPFYLYKYLVGRAGQSISSDVICKNMGIQISLISKRINLLGCVRNSVSKYHYDYLRGRLNYALINTYRKLLLYKGFKDLYSKLADLDSDIKSASPELFRSLGNLKFKPWLPIRFVNIWRKRNSNYQK